MDYIPNLEIAGENLGIVGSEKKDVHVPAGNDFS